MATDGTRRAGLRPAPAVALAAMLAGLLASGCAEDAEASRGTPLPPVQGAALDAAPPEPERAAPVEPRDADTVAEPHQSPAPSEPAVAEAAAAEPAAAEPAAAEPAAPEPAPAEPAAATESASGGTLAITFGDLALEDDIREDLLDALIYPEEYSEEERAFPSDVARLDGKRVAITGYMIPVLWKETKVTECMLVGDLLACCFGGAPEPDQWIEVTMAGSYAAEYYPFVPVVVTGVLRIAGIADDAGYAAGAYHIAAESLQKEL